MFSKKSIAIPTISVLTILAFGIWVYAQFQHGETSSASASVGTRIANTSASANVQGIAIPANTSTPPTMASFNAVTAVGLMVTDVNNDGKQDIVITVTTPPLPASANFPSGAPARHGVFITNGATGLTLVNIVVSAP